MILYLNNYNQTEEDIRRSTQFIQQKDENKTCQSVLCCVNTICDEFIVGFWKIKVDFSHARICIDALF